MKRVVVFGTGDFARVVHFYLSEDSPYEVAAFTVHEQYMSGDKFRGLEVIPFERLEATCPPEEFAMFVAIGYTRVNKARAQVYDISRRKGYELITYVNSRATHWSEVEIGDNCFIFEDNVIQPFVKIGNDVIMWSGNHVGHDSTIGDHCFIASHAVISGNVKIGPYCFIGVNATFRDGVTVAPECVIGAGALIVEDTEARGVYKGRRSEPAPYNSLELRGI